VKVSDATKPYPTVQQSAAVRLESRLSACRGRLSVWGGVVPAVRLYAAGNEEHIFRGESGTGVSVNAFCADIRYFLVALMLIFTACGGDTATTTSATKAPATTTMVTAASATSAAVATTEPTPATLAPTTTLVPITSPQSGDVVVAGVDGIWIVRDGAIHPGPRAEPTVDAMAAPDGTIVFQGVGPVANLNEWPLASWGVDAALQIIRPDGSTGVLYEGGDEIRLFQIASIPEVAAGYSAVFLRSDRFNLFPYRSDSIVVAPIDGSAPWVVEDVASYELYVNGLAWMGGFFVMSAEGDGFSFVDEIELDGDWRPWAYNPEIGLNWPVSHLTRLGETSEVVYASGTSLIRHDHNGGWDALSVMQVFGDEFIFKAIRASNDLIIVSGIERVGITLQEAPIVVFDAATWAPGDPSIEVIGRGSPVG